MATKHHGYEYDHMAVQCGGYICNPDDDLWYFWKEILPTPKSSPLSVGRLDVRGELNAEPDEFQELVLEKGVPLLLTFESANACIKSP